MPLLLLLFMSRYTLLQMPQVAAGISWQRGGSCLSVQSAASAPPPLLSAVASIVTQLLR